MRAKSDSQNFRHPVRAALIASVLLSALIGILMPFADRALLEAWPFALGYCALLAFWCIGFARNGPRSMNLFFGAALLAYCPAAVGYLLLRRGSPLETIMAWFGVSLYLFHAVGALALCLAIRGWYLYFSRGSSHPTTSTPGSTRSEFDRSLCP